VLAGHRSDVTPLYARTDPDWVRAEVDLLGDRMSGLSRREATKHISA
jgi:hypothetical protein